MRKRIIILALGLLSLAACSEKLTVVTTPVGMSLSVDEVKSSKVIFTITTDNPDAYYSYCLWNTVNGQTEALIDYLTSLAEDDYQRKQENGVLQIASFADLNCFRGTRTIRAINLQPDADFVLLVFQLNPQTHEVIGKVLSEPIHTKAVTITPLDFEFVYEGKTITVIPSDPDRTYFWQYDSQRAMYDNYIWPFGWFSSLVDMYEQYAFMDHLTSKGTVVYDAGRDNIKEGEILSVLAVAYEDGEMTSEYVEDSFQYRDGRFVHLSEEPEIED